MKHLPNILTLGNLFCGVLAVYFAVRSPAFLAEWQGTEFLVTTPPMLVWSSALIGLAAILDFFDGWTARLLGVPSEIGKQLDSLADLVTFGVAPGMILYYFLEKAWRADVHAIDLSLWLILPAFLLPCFAAWRLARFNLEASKEGYFTGVPTPAVGLTIASFPLIDLFLEKPMFSWLENPSFLYLLIAVFCLLMVSRISFFNLKIKSLFKKEALPQLLFVLLTLLAIPFLKWTTVPLIFALYVLFGCVEHLFFRRKTQ